MGAAIMGIKMDSVVSAGVVLSLPELRWVLCVSLGGFLYLDRVCMGEWRGIGCFKCLRRRVRFVWDCIWFLAMALRSLYQGVGGRRSMCRWFFVGLSIFFGSRDRGIPGRLARCFMGRVAVLAVRD